MSCRRFRACTSLRLFNACERRAMEARSSGRQNAQPLASRDAIGLEVVVVDREDGGERLALCQVHEGAVREIRDRIVAQDGDVAEIAGVHPVTCIGGPDA